MQLAAENNYSVPIKPSPLLTLRIVLISLFTVHIGKMGKERCRLVLKCDGTRAETRFRLSAKRTNPFKSAGGRQFSRLLTAELCASAVVMLDTACSEVV